MTKKDIIDEVFRKTGVTKEAIQAVIDEAIYIVADSVCNGEPIYIRGLFTIAPLKRAEKVGRNIKKKEQIVIPAHYTPHAKFSKEIQAKMRELPIN